MKNIRRSTAIGLLLCGMLGLAANSWAQQRDPIIEKVAKVYGLDSYDKIEAIRYTWNIDIPGLFKASHKWEWEPKTGKIIFESTDKDGKPVKVAYDSSQLSSQPEQVQKEVEPAFVNDNYWLDIPLPRFLGQERHHYQRGHEEVAGRRRLGHAGHGEVSTGSRRLYAGRHLGPLRRQRQPSRATCLPSRRRQEAERGHRELDRLQEGRRTTGLD